MLLIDFSLQIAHRVDEVGSQAWDRLSGDRSLASYRWYRFAETVLTNDKAFYIIVLDQAQPIGRATLWLTWQEPLPVASPLARRVMEAVLRRRPLLVCRTPLSSVSGLILPNPPLHTAALAAIIQAAQELMRQHHASALMFDYLTHDEAQWASWPPAFGTVAMPQPGTCLDITWPDFDSYLHQLPKSVQKDYRRHRNRAADLGVVITSDRVPPPASEALMLIRNVERHHHTSPHPLTEAILHNSGAIDGTWLKATIESRLVGCGLLAGEGGVRFLTLLGLDYEVQYVYFQLFYAAIRCAIEEGVRVLRGGTSAYEIKQRLGFRLDDNNYVSYVANGRLMNWIARRMT